MTADVVWLDEHKDGSASLLFDCPGCGFLHGPMVRAGEVPPQKPVWEWNGSLVTPTLTPSLLVRWEHGEAREKRVCHSFIRDGRIQFLGDCTHELAGQTVALSAVRVEGE